MASCARVRCRDGARALVGCVAIVSVLALCAPASAASSATVATSSPPVRLLHVTPVVQTPGQLVNVALTRTGPGAAPGATVLLTLYSRLTTRSALESAIATPGPTGPVSSTGQLKTSCLSAGPILAVSVAVLADGVTPAHRELCGRPAPVLRLGCTTSCDGVYPLRVTVTGGGKTASLVTLVTYATDSSAPLRLSWVIRVAGQSDGLAASAPALAGVSAHRTVPVTVDVEGRAVAIASPSTAAGRSLATLREVATRPSDQLITEAYVPANLGTLRASGLPAEVTRQFALNRVVLRSVGVRTSPTPTVTLGTGPQTSTSADAVASVGYHDLIVDGGALAVDPSSTLAWGAPFRIGGSPFGPTALATDTVLSTLSNDTTADPGLSAANFLGELAFLHFEQPNLAVPRVAVVVTNATSSVTTAFVDSVLVGLRDNPVVTPVTASSAFRLVPLGANGFPAVRDVALPPASPFPHATVTFIRYLRITTDGLSSAVESGQSPIPSIEGELLSAQRAGLPSSIRTATLRDVQERLADELGNFHIYDGPITLTESGASLPITVISSAPYVVRGSLVLSSPKLVFPSGSTSLVPGFSSVYSVRIAATAQVTGDLPLTVKFFSPQGQLLMAHAVITVRATQTSIVAIVLTALAVLVLALWWIRTSRRRRHAAHE